MRSKRYKEAKSKAENKSLEINEAINKVKETATANFDESVEITVVLGVDPRKSDQMVRGNLVLPHGTGKEVKVAVVAEGEDIKAAEKAGADLAGKDKVIDLVQKGNLDFDVLIATPSCMKDLGKLGRILGPQGLMPSPKSGTVVENVAEAVEKVKKGQIEFKMDRNGVVHASIGKVSFEDKKISDNFNAYLNSVKRSRPASTKGRFIKKVTLSATMGPSVSIEL
ncbi:MAG: 50S ribosomal protein L1 [Elusimicrobia bacterium]|nr:50S ribosomal protein L1 [Elusimicrobiota bacterium]